MQSVSANRLRVGVVFFILFWIPFWLLSPIIIRLLGDKNDPQAQHTIFIVVITIQTIFGIIGVIIAGKEVLKIFRHTSYKKAPKVIWHLLKSGALEQ